uniref:ABC transporter permease n=1 Tax=Streptomyces sp. NBC_00049 TaxID=2903617 RepID=A0AAU2JP14_9ACTN
MTPYRTTDAGPTGGRAEWRDTTDEVFGLLHGARRAHRVQKRRDTAFHVYVVLLLTAMYLVPFGALAYGAAGSPREPWATSVSGALPFAGTALALAWFRVVVGDARWRGPVLLDAATASWLLPAPVDRGRLLRPRLRRTIVLHGAGAGLLTAVATYFLNLVVLGRPTAGIALAAAAAAVFGALAAATAGLVVSRDAIGPARRAAAALTVLAAAALLCAVLDAPAWLRPLFLWSGPWGWVTQCLAAASGSAPTGWPAAAALLVACAVWVIGRADREIAAMPVGVLLRRIRSAASVTAAVVTVDFRQARLAARGPESGVRRFRPPVLPPPRRPWLAVPWRTAAGWLAGPARLGWAAVWLAGAYTAVTVAPAAQGPGRIAAVLSALAAGYAATVGLLEAARLDGDDVNRSRALPWTFPGIVLRHALLPLAVLLPAGAVACALLASLGRPVLPAVLLLCCFPALLGAALISACRGTLPYELLLGADTVMGNTAVLQVAVWYLRGPMAACVVLFPFLAYGLRSVEGGAPSLPAGAVLGGGLLLGTTALAAWAGMRAWSHVRS